MTTMSATPMDGCRTIRITATTMPEPAGQAALLRLMTWLSPAFPVGAFSYSHGLERAIHDGMIHDRESLVGWLTDIVERGSGWNDALLFAEAWRADADVLPAIAELAEAMAGSRERHMETTLQGGAFLDAIVSWSGRAVAEPLDIGTTAYPVAVGQAAAAYGVPLDAALLAYLHAFASNLVQAAVRLVPLGQRDGVATMAALEPVILETAERASHSNLNDLGSATFLSEIMAMRHETLYSRVFRS